MLVMIRTISTRPLHLPPPLARRRRLLGARLAAERGDTLIEVLISAVLIGLVVVGTLTGLNATNRSTALQRARSQADAIAQQNEDQLRSESIKKLSELESRPETATMKENGTTYTISTEAKYIADSTATASCNSSAAQANYLQTTTKVTWPSLGPGKPVVESGIISPPAGAALIVQVTESGTAVPQATVVATGPLPAATAHSLETSTNGCAILAVSPGEYDLNVSKTGYVDPNGYPNTDEDTSVTRSVYLPAETTAKEGFNIGLAGNLAVSFTGSVPAEADQFVAFNSGMTTFRLFGTLGTYSSTINTPTTIFPFTTDYTVYPGSCEADVPPSSVISADKSNFEVLVPRGGTGSLTTLEPPITIRVLESNKGLPEKPLQNALVRIEDTGCKTVHESHTTATGALPRPGMPFGTYSLCALATIATKVHKYTTTFTSSSATGTTLPTIYLNEEPEGTGKCP